MRKVARWLGVVAGIALITSSVQAYTYQVGDYWQRSKDWTAGSNPDDDSYGTAEVWTYGYDAGSLGTWNSANMTWNSGGYWYNSSYGFTRIYSNSMHPTVGCWPDARWTSPIDGMVKISGTIYKPTSGSDGVIVYISRKKVDGTLLGVASYTLNGACSTTTYAGQTCWYVTMTDVTLTVEQGEMLFFRVSPGGNNSSDMTYFDPTITITSIGPYVYQAGDFWQRSVDWTAGSNPDDDHYGTKNVWSYDGINTTDGTVVPMAWSSTNNWFTNTSDAYCLVMKTQFHPGVNCSTSAIWTSPVAGKVHITGNLSKDPGSSDGVITGITYHNNADGTYLRLASHDLSVKGWSYSYDLTQQVAVGDKLLFWVNMGGNNASDTTNWDPKITLMAADDGVDGAVSQGEYPVIGCDQTGGANDNGSWVSETHLKYTSYQASDPAITDISRWGCKVEDGMFYGFIQLKGHNISELDGGSASSSVPCSFYGFFIDVDNSQATGYAHEDFPYDMGFDLDLEAGSDFGSIGSAGTVNFWYGSGNFGSYVHAANAKARYVDNTIEICCPVADILAKAGVSETNGRFWRVAPRAAGCLPDSGAADWASDVAPAMLIDTTGAASAVAPTMDGQINDSEWAGNIFTDMTLAGVNSEADGTTTSGGTSDLMRWGAKIVNGVYYGFVELDHSDGAYGIDAYNDGIDYGSGKYRRFNPDEFVDIDGYTANGYEFDEFPAGMDRCFDLAFEAEVSNTITPMTLWTGDTSTTSYYTSCPYSWSKYVFEWSCPMSEIAKATDAQSSHLADLVRVAARVNGTLRDTVGWSYDCSDGSMMISNQATGDVNEDGVVNSADIDALNTLIAEGGATQFHVDYNGDQIISKLDVDVLVGKIMSSTYGDANLDGKVDVGDLGILAANYGGTGKGWGQGDFNGDGTVDVGDLGILAANYGKGTVSGADFNADYAKVFGTAATSKDAENTAEDEETASTVCSSLGLSLIAGLALMGLMIVKLEE